MTRKWHNHKLQTNLRHREEEAQNTNSNSNITSKGNLSYSNEFSLPQRDDCKTRGGTKYCAKNKDQTQTSHKAIGATINNDSTTTEPLP